MSLKLHYYIIVKIISIKDYKVDKTIREGIKMKYYKILIIAGFMFLIGCARMAGYKEDYYVFNKDEIKTKLTNTTIIEKFQNSKNIYYIAPNSKYLIITSNNSGVAQLDKGQWYTKDDIMHISGKEYKIGYICFKSDIKQNVHCSSFIRNGGNFYFKDLLHPKLQISATSGVFLKTIKSIGTISLSSLKQIEFIVGKSEIIDQKIREEKRRIAKEKERKRLEKLRREREEKARKARAASRRSTQSSYYSNTQSISLCYPSIPQPIDYSECSGARTASGSYAMIKLSRGGGGLSSANCFDLNIYANGNIAVGNTCGGVNGSWSVRVNGQSGFANGLGNAIAWLLQRM